MQDKHTPGPWRAEWFDENNAWVMDAKGNYLTELVTGDEEGKCADGDAQVFNLTLMAAAPELLKTCQVVLEHIMQTDRDYTYGGNIVPKADLAEYIRLAIAKATGL